MDISHLKTFLEIYRIRHFGKAADKLFITQSAASARIKLLEEQLGVKLFERDKKSVSPTTAGHRFHKYAEMSVFGWEQARQVVALPEEYQDALTIGCLADIWHLFLKEWVIELYEETRQTALHFEIHSSEMITERVMNGILDIGLVFEPRQIPGIESLPLHSSRLKLLTTERQLRKEDIKTFDYIMVDWGANFRHEYTQHQPDLPMAAHRTNYGIMALDILQAKGGSAYLPEQLLTQNSIKLYEVEGMPEFKRELSLIYRQDSGRYELVLKLAKLLRGLVKNSQPDSSTPTI